MIFYQFFGMNCFILLMENFVGVCIQLFIDKIYVVDINVLIVIIVVVNIWSFLFM